MRKNSYENRMLAGEVGAKLAAVGTKLAKAGGQLPRLAAGWQSQLCTGLVLAAMACFAVRIDILNNYSYGITISPELASIMVLAAIGVVAIPVAAAVLGGWSIHLRLTAVICVLLTVWAAINAYTSKQGAQILAAQDTQKRYVQAGTEASTAREDAKKARNEANAISEAISADALGKLVEQAQARVNELSSRAKELGASCAINKKCQAAENELMALTSRLGYATTKANALARASQADEKVEAAKREAQGGPAEPSMLATVIAARTGADAAAVARYIALAMTFLGILLTQLVALLGGQAASLITGAMKTRLAISQQKPASQKTKPDGPPKGGMKVSAPRLGCNVVKLDSARQSVQRWLDQSTGSGGEMRRGDALKAYKRRAGPAGANMSAEQFQSILENILGRDAIVRRTSGCVIVGRSLRVAEKHQHGLRPLREAVSMPQF